MNGPDATIRIGFMPLLDAAIPVVAARCGFARRHGLELKLMRETSWANVRDRLAIGHFEAAHLLAPLPIAAALGLTPFDVPLIAPMVLAHGGNAITVSTALWTTMQAGSTPPTANEPRAMGRALRRVVEERRRNGEPALTFAVVHAISSHNYELRYWLASEGIEPEQDISIAIVPPPYMADALAAGRIDGYCVGEPWNSRAASAGSGSVILTKQAIWPDSPDKVLAMRADWADRHPDRAKNLMLALLEAARWCADPAHREELVAIMADPDILGVDPADIRPALTGRMSMAGGPETVAPLLEFHARGANRPRRANMDWYLRQMIRWNQAPDGSTLDFDRLIRPDLYRNAARDLGLASEIEEGKDATRLYDDMPQD